MKFYSGNTKRVIKKYARFYFDGVAYRWDTAMAILQIMSRLRPGHKVWIPWTKQWGTFHSVEFQRYHLRNHRNSVGPEMEGFIGRAVNGWWIGEATMSVVADDGTLYYVYDFEHWNPWDRLNIPEDERVMFNRQVGLPDDYRPAWWKDFSDWEEYV